MDGQAHGILDALTCALALRWQHRVGCIADQDHPALCPGRERVLSAGRVDKRERRAQRREAQAEEVLPSPATATSLDWETVCMNEIE